MDQVLDKSTQIVRPLVLIVQIVCMFPNIHHQKRSCAMRDGCVRICGFGNLQRIIFQNGPCPPTAELRDTGSF